MTERICLALDLGDDEAMIAEYERWHRVGNTPVAVIQSIRDSGIRDMEIFRAGERLSMVTDVDGSYDAAAKTRADAANPAVVGWVKRMVPFQWPVSAAGPEGDGVEMKRVFRLTDHPDTGSAPA